MDNVADNDGKKNDALGSDDRKNNTKSSKFVGPISTSVGSASDNKDNNDDGRHDTMISPPKSRRKGASKT